jgi:hypothetical protein
VKSLVELWEYLLLDCSERCCRPCARDLLEVKKRVEHEGDSFITITLPQYCQDFERSLDGKEIGPTAFRAFKKHKGGRIPEFLRSFVSGVFDSDGRLRDAPSVDCIRAVRQLCLFAKKIGRPCSESRVSGAIAGYEASDDDCIETLPEGKLADRFRKVAKIICDDLGLTREILTDFMPKHGPGATAEHILGNQKWLFRSWPERLDEVGITYYDHVFPFQEINEDDLEDWPESLEPGAEHPIRVVTVPKTMKTPRIIGVEPVAMQFAQQGIKDVLVPLIEGGSITGGHVNFSDQQVNKDLALEASGSGHMATIDMSEASDRVSMAHFDGMFGDSPVRDILFACRSQRAQLPGGAVRTLRKFASMGSALCFPVEALVFFTTILASRLSRAGVYPTKLACKRFSKSVFVYGDDIIVPSHEASTICDDLEALGFRVNKSKSFWTGKFRESCGMDAYDNLEVTPVYLRRDVPTDRGDSVGVTSCVATANQLFDAGYRRTATAIKDAVERLVGKLPTVTRTCPALGWFTHSNSEPRLRVNRKLQRCEFLGLLPTPARFDDQLKDRHALAKCFRVIGSPVTPTHLIESPRPYSLTLKRRWVDASNLASGGACFLPIVSHSPSNSRAYPQPRKTKAVTPS